MRLRVRARKRFVCVYARNDAPLLKYTNSNGRPLARNEWYGVFVLSLSVFFNNRPSASRRALLLVQTRVSSPFRIRFRMRSCAYVYMCVRVYDLYTDFSFAREMDDLQRDAHAREKLKISNKTRAREKKRRETKKQKIHERERNKKATRVRGLYL